MYLSKLLYSHVSICRTHSRVLYVHVMTEIGLNKIDFYHNVVKPPTRSITYSHPNTHICHTHHTHIHHKHSSDIPATMIRKMCLSPVCDSWLPFSRDSSRDRNAAGFSAHCTRHGIADLLIVLEQKTWSIIYTAFDCGIHSMKL